MQPYPNPPIIEALIYVNIEPKIGFDVSAIEHLTIEDYAEKRPQFLFQGQFQMGDEISSTSVREKIGYMFESTDKKRLLQIRTNGFSCSHLAPYTRWDGFCEEAKNLWDVYSKTLGDVKITQIGLRYVNRIELTLPLNDLKDWLQTFPEIGSDAGPDFSHFFMQVHVPQLDIGALAIINETIQPREIPPKAVYIMLDIDLTKNVDVPQDSKSLWEQFQILRDRKNKIFVGCITKKTEELFV
jgi:uncharacterized protein (TIGR04255 family)